VHFAIASDDGAFIMVLMVLDGWLQVLACGSTCTPGIVQEYSFNSVRIFDEGFVDCMAFSCPQATVHLNHWETRRLGTAPYEEIRKQLSAEKRQTAPPSTLCCDNYTKRVLINAQTGDLVVDDVIVGLRTCGGPCDHHDIPFRATTYSGLAFFEAQIIRKGGAKQTLRPRPSVEDNSVVLSLLFEPPLTADDYATLMVRRSAEGAAFLSKEAQDQWIRSLQRDEPDIEKPGDELLQYTVSLFCRSFTFAVEFELPEGTRAEDYFEEDFRPIVRRVSNSKLQDATHEAESGLLSLTRSSLFPVASSRQTAQPILHVIDPLLSYRYGITWKLPSCEPMRQRDRILEYRRLIMTLEHDRHRRDLADAFLQELSRRFADNEQVSGLVAGLYGSDGQGFLVRLADANAEHWGLPQRGRWGRGILGKTYQRGVASLASRAMSPPRDSVIQAPEDLGEMAQHLLTYPLNMPGIDGWPIGVVALGGSDAASKLGQALAAKGKRFKDFCELVEKTWREHAAGILGVT
jgi:hypothetical protein